MCVREVCKGRVYVYKGGVCKGSVYKRPTCVKVGCTCVRVVHIRVREVSKRVRRGACAGGCTSA